MDDHTLQQVIDLAVKTAVLKAKKEAILECRPVGSYFITETEDDPNVLFGGGWQKLTGRYVLQCSDANHKAGTTVEAGLPNITGIINTNQNALDPYGVFTWSTSTGPNFTHNPNSFSGPVNILFDASRSSNIYGNSDTVQPPARIVNVWKRVS